MGKAIFAISVTMGSLIAITAPVRAEVITYRCDENPNQNIFRIDTKTHSAQEISPGYPPLKGTAQINGAMIVVTLTSPRVWSIQINRNTGTFSDSDGDTGNCQLVK